MVGHTRCVAPQGEFGMTFSSHEFGICGAPADADPILLIRPVVVGAPTS